MITSKSNAKVKNVVDLQKHAKTRAEQKAYIVEGLKMFRELSHESIKEVFVTDEFAKEHEELLHGLPVEIVDERIFSQMADTKTPQGIICVVKWAEYDLEGMMRLRVKPAMTMGRAMAMDRATAMDSAVAMDRAMAMDSAVREAQPFLMILEDLQDPGNVGTIFRTAEGAGINGIILSKNCVDVYNPKTVRGAMGSISRVPFIYAEDLIEVLEQLKVANIRTYAAHLDGVKMYDQADYKNGCAFLIGNEGKGLSEKLARASDELVKIEMKGEVESLNAAIAATVLMYEGARQRRG